MINEGAIKSYLMQKYEDIVGVEIRKLGSGVQGSGFLVEMNTETETRSYVVKGLLSEGLGHDYPSDRAAVFLLDLEEYKKLPKHVKAVDVLSEMEDGTLKSIGGGREYYLLMERGEGTDYFHDLRQFAGKENLGDRDRKRIGSMASYLAEIHSVRKDAKTLYWRKLRDTVGHGECLMGVFDTYPDGTLSYREMADIEKKCVDWRAKLKPLSHRLSQIHGDFHPGNIWFRGDDDFILLDRSRGAWGEPADDVTALAINYIFFSVRSHGNVRGSYYEGLDLFFDEYIRASGDRDITGVVAPFFAFRAVVVANPVFYPDLPKDAREKMFNFTRAVLSAERFEVERVNEYLKG
ncbi:MAG: aminoglycoside phosphotransferase family protein [Nitrospiraceae bacterium]|nr:aminoglycoside phosphotransferase family protein [Nitrospiraceae bacterium]